MVQRFALFVASLVAVAVLVVGMVAAGVGPSATGLAAIASPSDTAATPSVQIDTVYVAPPQVPQTVEVQRTVSASAGGENESEGAGG